MATIENSSVSLESVTKAIYRIGGPILFIFGIINCTINLIVFLRKAHRKNPCSIYLAAVNLMNLLYIFLSMSLACIAIGYDLNLYSRSLFICRFVNYGSYLFDILSSTYLILASIDRVFITSSNALTRQRSTRRLACISIATGTIFWMILLCHILIFMDIQEISPGYSICYYRAGVYVVVMNYYTLIIKMIVVPLVLIITGIWTTRNIREVRHRRILPDGSSMENREQFFYNRKDRQLITIIIADICLYVIWSGMLSISTIYQRISEIAAFARTNIYWIFLGAFIYNLTFCTNCYVYLIVSKKYRQEVKRIFLCK
ncbi:unnamed protein product [Adineta ricciae]|uniref:G-protein coupled receptors family 1 profile domain-containing protein n=1 Tax=Adineta ricciae TaxID=249248 RepID=A0A813NTG3_ADIRI|nr:unnamed protein product [Adineta ricciae]CAF1342967.1 unnamed protein product [Adineta ricciae]